MDKKSLGCQKIIFTKIANLCHKKSINKQCRVSNKAS